MGLNSLVPAWSNQPSRRPVPWRQRRPGRPQPCDVGRKDVQASWNYLFIPSKPCHPRTVKRMRRKVRKVRKKATGFLNMDGGTQLRSGIGAFEEKLQPL